MSNETNDSNETAGVESTLASIDDALTYFSAGLGGELTVRQDSEDAGDYVGASAVPDPQQWADDEAIARAVPAGRLEDLTPRQMRRWIFIQTPEWQASLAEQLDRDGQHVAAAMVRDIAADRAAQI